MLAKQFVRFLLCLVVTLSLSATGAMGAEAREALVAHLKFEGNADDELDNVIAATLVGAPTFGAGVDGLALFLDGETDFVDLGPEFGPSVMQPLTSFSSSVWAKGDKAFRRWPRAWQFGNSNDSEYVALLPYSNGTPEFPSWGAMGGPRFELKKAGYGDGKATNLTLNAPDTVITQNEWANIVTVLDADTNYAAIYVNGELAVDTNDFTRNPSIVETYNQNYIGHSADGNLFHGGIDDLQIYNRVLSPAEIELIASGKMVLSEPPALARKPKPRNGVINVPQEVALTWKPGAYVEGLSPKHRVFFSENFEDVNDGIGGIEQDVERYPIEGSLKLDLGKTCYWRVDEANSTSGWDIGPLWRFTVIDHLVVDDFEDYNDYPPDDIFSAWKDGYDVDTNGALIGYNQPDIDAGEHFVETEIVHGDKQSMPYFYNNIGTATYSEAECIFSPAQDWTREGVGVLSLWFKGHPPYVGGFVEAPPGTYTMIASGTDIWATADEFHFASKQVTGASAIIAKVESVGHTDPWAKAGVMIRDTLDADSRNVAVFITPENGVRFQYRSVAGGITQRYFAEGITAPQWVKLERTAGGLVRGYYSEDGATWSQFNLTQVRMDMPIYVGLAVTSHNANATCEAKFSNVSFPDISVDPQWTDQDVGMLSNEAEPMYVTVEDGSGTTATVYHNDPDATLLDTWTEWNIDTKEFGDAGVVLTDVRKLAIGFGGADNPQPGGSGLVFFDDIRLYPPPPELAP